jgi:tRNA/rRNA methyltransferase/tRNA (cytidine32/uridine32-2'-O)-methyltransferase
MRLSDIIVVLCRPAQSGNVGAVCRAMKNMGLSRLYLVAPGPLDGAEVLSRAVHAGEVWLGSRVFASLADAVCGCALAVGTTARRGQKRKPSMVPGQLAAWLARRETGSGVEQAPVALVFGNERTGLSRQELDACSIASHIPVSGEFPSLNLSHAVQVYTYELFLAFGKTDASHVKGQWVPVDTTGAEKLADEIAESLAGIGFYKKQGNEMQRRFLRDIICRAGLTEREGRYLAGIFGKAAGLAGRDGCTGSNPGEAEASKPAD